MGVRIRLSSSQIVQISTITRELLQNTPVTELRHALMFAAKAVDRIGREIAAPQLPPTEYLEFEKRLISFLREIRTYSKELRTWERTCEDKARDVVIAQASANREAGIKPDSFDPSIEAPEPPEPEGHVDAEVQGLQERLNAVAETLENGEIPEDTDIISDVVAFADRTSKKAEAQQAKHGRNEVPKEERPLDKPKGVGEAEILRKSQLTEEDRP
ncbi:hypothetical protein OAU50_06440 [Planctomycetota bacterium]|nr:hypothetical protein [Planctomycetota bacterium]